MRSEIQKVDQLVFKFLLFSILFFSDCNFRIPWGFVASVSCVCWLLSLLAHFRVLALSYLIYCLVFVRLFDVLLGVTIPLL